MAKIRHLQLTHDLKSYSNACRVVKQLSPYINETMFDREKVLYLNKEGRELIGSTREMKKNSLMEHTLLGNEVYFHFNCPVDWKTEYTIEKEPLNTRGILFGGMSLVKQKIVADACFTRNGYLHLIEVDNTRSMIDNRKKIDSYADMLVELKKRTAPILCVFTTNKERKRKFEDWMKKKNIRGEVKTFEEIK